MKLKGSVIFNLFLVFLLLFLIYHALGLRYGAWKFPLIIALPTLALAIVQLRRELRGREMRGRIFDVAPEESVPTSVAYQRAGKYFLWIVGLYGIIWLLGFKLGFLIFFVLFLKLEGRRTWLTTVLLTGLVVFIIVVQYEKLFGVHWPEGFIEQYITLPF